TARDRRKLSAIDRLDERGEPDELRRLAGPRVPYDAAGMDRHERQAAHSRSVPHEVIRFQLRGLVGAERAVVGRVGRRIVRAVMRDTVALEGSRLADLVATDVHEAAYTGLERQIDERSHTQHVGATRDLCMHAELHQGTGRVDL